MALPIIKHSGNGAGFMDFKSMNSFCGTAEEDTLRGVLYFWGYPHVFKIFISNSCIMLDNTG